MRIVQTFCQFGAVALVIMGVTSGAQAATCAAGAAVSYEADVTSSSGTASCWGYGNGNLAGANGNPNLTTVEPLGVPNGTNPLTHFGFEYLGDLGSLAGTTLTGLGGSGPGGTWSFTAQSGLDYVLGFKAGTGNQSFEWAAFLINGLLPGLVTGSWDVIASRSGGLSHVGLYSFGDPGQVPLPGAVFLFGTVLAAGWGVKKWRQGVAG